MVSFAMRALFEGCMTCKVRMLCSRSASLIRITRTSFDIARSILRKFSACSSSCESNFILSSLDTPSTRSATTTPNNSSISSFVTAVSSTTSWRRAAAKAGESRCQSASILETATGWDIYGSPVFLNWPS